MTTTIQVRGNTSTSDIHVGETLENVRQYLPDLPVIIITDQNVRNYYATDFPEARVITIGTGEGIKTLATVETIYRELIRLESDRHTFILGIGGGIVCDIAGFVAATYMRGLRFGFVSTTLLSQVDASVGGKNGVNLDAFKNMVGVFAQPEFVLCDISLLASLPFQEIVNGFGEIVKHALIADRELFEFLEANAESALNLDPEVITHLVTRCVQIKADVVRQDETEIGQRRMLNFGHTIGHALEKLTGTGHGSAVSLGMVAAAGYSRTRGLLTDADVQRILALLKRLSLPVTHDVDPALIADAVRKDKKRAAAMIYFVFLSGIGSCQVDAVNLSDLEDMIKSA